MKPKASRPNPPPDPDLDELIRQYGTEDLDELIYRATVPQADIDKMRAAGPVQRDFPLLSSPELAQVQQLMKLTKAPSLQLRVGQLSVELYRQAL